MTNTILTWHNDAALKAKAIKLFKGHIAADTLVRGTYGKVEYERLAGIPAPLAHLQEFYFENLPADHAQQWAPEFLEAIKVGVLYDKIMLAINRQVIWLLVGEDNPYRTIQYCEPDGVAATEQVVALHERVLRGEAVSQEEWEAAARAAWAAARDAGDAARAAWAAARAAGAAAGAAGDAAIKLQADNLIELLKEST